MTATMVYFKILFTLCCCSNLIFVRTHEYDGDEYADVEADDDLANYLKEAIENLRSQMTKGIPEINMPVLDPLHLEDMDIKVRENVASIDLQIQELNIKGLSTFTIHKLIPDMEAFYISVDLSIPLVEADGQYKVSGKVMNIFPLRGNGNCGINITNARISGESKLTFIEDTMQMEALKLNLKWSDLNLHLENFLGGGRFSVVLQQLFPKIGKSAFDHFNPKIMDALNGALTKIVNRELQKPKVKEIINNIFGKQL